MKKDLFSEERKQYAHIEIPDELSGMVQRTIKAQSVKRKKKRYAQYVKFGAGFVAAALLIGVVYQFGVGRDFVMQDAHVDMESIGRAEELTLAMADEKDASPEYAMAEEAYFMEDAGEAEAAQNLSESVSMEPARSLEEWVDTLTPEKLSEASAQDVICEVQEEATAEEQVTSVTATAETAAPMRDSVAAEEFENTEKASGTELPAEKVTSMSEKADTILLAQIPDEDIRLYGYHYDGANKGVALQSGTNIQTFGWTYFNEEEKLPEMTLADIDEDGMEEILILLFNEASNEVKSVALRQEVDGEEAPSAFEEILGEDAEEELIASWETRKGEAKGSVDETIDMENDTNVINTQEEEADPIEAEDIAYDKNDFPGGELWVVKLFGDSYSAYTLSAAEYRNQILDRLEVVYDESEQLLTIWDDGEELPYSIDLYRYIQQDMKYASTILDGSLSYDLSDGVCVDFRLGVCFEGEDTRMDLIPTLCASLRGQSAGMIVDNIYFKN